MSNTHATRGRRVLAFLLGLLLALSMIPAEALAFARDEIIVLDAEETIEDVTVDTSDKFPVEVELEEEYADALEQTDASNETLTTQSDDIVESGTWGTCPWTLSSDGTLTVMPGNAPEKDENDYYGFYYEKPWSGRQDPITTIRFVAQDGAKVVLPSNSELLFSELSSVVTMDLSGADVSNVTNAGGMFSYCSSLTSVNVAGWDTSKLTNTAAKNISYMDYPLGMFEGCSLLKSVDLSSWNTSNVSNLASMFRGCSSLESIDLSAWNVSNVTDTGGMFYGCSSLESINVTGWDTSKLTNTAGRTDYGDTLGMFEGCSSLESIDLSGLDTSRVTNLNAMFSGCSSLKSINLSSWDVSNVTKMGGMFYACSGLTSIDLSEWDTSSVTQLEIWRIGEDLGYHGHGLFQDCSSLTSVNVTNWDVSNVGDLSHTFAGCTSLKSLDISDWDVSNVTAFSDSSGSDQASRGMFAGCSSLKSLDLSKWDVSSARSIAGMFTGCSSLESINLSGWDVSNASSLNYDDDYSIVGLFNGCSSLTSIDLTDWKLGSDVPRFCNLNKLTEIKGIETWDTSQVTTMDSVFEGCSSLESLNLSNWDVSNTRYYFDVFSDCSSLTTLNMSNWDVSNAAFISFGSMLSGCTSLTQLDVTNWKLGEKAPSFSGLDTLTEIEGISSWDISKATSLSDMFSGCSALESLDLSGWDTSKVTDMTSMFESCTNLASLNLSGWNTSNARSTKSMFSGCFSLESLDLSSWDTSKMTSVESMFASCSALDSIKVGQNYKIRSAEMFPNATSENDQWWSEGTAQWYSKNQIVRNRSGIADTYTAERDPEVKIDIADATILNISAQEWTGEALEPKPLVKLNGRYLTEGTDYELAYANNVEVGEATVTATGMGNYTGTVSTTFQIEPVSIRSATISEIPSQTYTGNAVEPKPAVTLQDTTLTEGEDYELRYYSNVNAGTAAITITGKGNYSGAISIEFEIEPVSLGGTTISAIEAQTYTGKALTPRPRVSLGEETLTEGADYTLEYANNVEVGTAIITATGRGNYNGEKSTQFKIEVPPVELTSLESAIVAPIAPAAYTGRAIEPKPVISVGTRLFVEGIDYELSYANNVTAGEATVTATGKGTCTDSISATFAIEPASIKLATVSDIPTQTYTGGAVEPRPTVTFRGVRLSEGDDYELRYYSNISAGTAVAFISGKGNYQGEKAVAFQIVSPEVGPTSLETASIAPLPSSTYTGAAIEPKPTVTANGRLLVEDDDYVLSYSDNVNAGTATVIVTGKGNYIDSTTVAFQIEPVTIKSATVSDIPDQTYSGKAVEPKPAVDQGDATLTEGADYELRYYGNVNVGTAVAVISGTGNYRGEKSVEFAIRPTPIAGATVPTIETQTYTGKALTPRPRVSLDEEALTEGADYTLAYENNVEVGTATITIVGKGNYTGELACNFRIEAPAIEPTSLEEAVVPAIPSQTYTGSAIEPKPTVVANGKLLTQDVDYSLSYTDNVNAGTATIIVTSKGYCTGSTTTTFEIEPASLSSASIAAIADVAYTGNAVRPKPAVALNNTVLKEGTDYGVHYFNNIGIGTAFVTITGRNNYTGVQVATFKIAAPPISNATISTIADQTYTGKAITPKPTVTLGQIKLAENVDYTLEYLNNTNVGAGVVVLTGCGNYEGAKVATFNIQAASLSPATVSTIAGQSYTGQAVEPKPSIALNGVPLREGTDYTLAYKNNTNAGTASVTATGKGNYTGTKTVAFAIAKASNALSVQANKKSVKRSAVKKKAKAVAPLKVAGANGTVTYSRVTSGSAPQLKVNKKTGKVTVKKGTKKGTYAVKIKVTASGDANHLPMSKVVTAKVVVK